MGARCTQLVVWGRPGVDELVTSVQQVVLGSQVPAGLLGRCVMSPITEHLNKDSKELTSCMLVWDYRINRINGPYTSRQPM